MSSLIAYIRWRIARYNARTAEIEAELRALALHRDAKRAEWYAIKNMIF